MRQIFAFIALGLMAVMALYGFQTALISAGDDITVENETFTPSTDIIVLDDSRIDGAFYDQKVTVRNTSGTNNTIVEEGEAYQWFQKNGTLTIIEGSSMDGSGATEGQITYEYQETTQEQRDWARILGFIPQVIGLMLPILAILALIVIVRG